MEQKNQDFEQEKPHFGAGKSILGAVKMTFGAREKICKDTNIMFLK